MPFYQSGSVRLHYVCREAQAGVDGSAMVFQHGIGGDVRQPGRFLISERTGIPHGSLRLIHADFRGHGASELGPEDELSMKILGDDLVALLDRLELDAAIVGGISMGAAAALRLAVQHPSRCRALVLCRPAWVEGPMSVEAREAYALAADLLSAEDWQASACEALEQSEIFRWIQAVCPDAAKSLQGQVQAVLSRPERREHAIEVLRTLPFANGLDDSGESLSAVRCPTLILAAKGDPIHPFEYATRLSELLPNSRLKQINPKSAVDDRAHLAEVDQEIGEFIRVLRA